VGVDDTSTSFDGNISGVDLVKAGTGTFTLNAANNNASATVHAGTLALGLNDALAPDAVQVDAGATLDLNRHSLTLGSLSGAGTVTSSLGPILIFATLTTGVDDSSTTFTGVIKGDINLVKDGTGTFTLGGVNTYDGTTSVLAGTLRQGISNAVPPTALFVAPGATFDVNLRAASLGSLAGGGKVLLSDPTMTVGLDNTSTTFSGVISGDGSLSKVGTGSFTLSGANTYTGVTSILAGMLSLGSSSALPPVATEVGSGAILDLNGHSITLGSLSGLPTGSGTVQSLGAVATLTTGQDNSSTSYNGAINGAINFIKVGTGTFTVGGMPKKYTGSTHVQSGQVALGSERVLPPVFTLVDPEGSLDMSGHAASLGSLAGNGKVKNSGSPATLTTGQDNLSTTFGGQINGQVNLIKAGTGKFALGGVNTYTGSTRVQGGTLSQSIANSLPLTAATVAAGAQLNLNGLNARFASLQGAGTIMSTNDPTLSVGADGSSAEFDGVVEGAIALVKLGTGTFTLAGANTYTGPTSVVDGTLRVTGSLSSSTDVSVDPGAKVTGTGTVPDITIDGTSGNDAFVINATLVTLNGTAVVTTPYTTLTLKGALGNDTFHVLGTSGGSTTTLDGGAGTNTLIGPNATNTWSLTGPGAGTVGSVGFANMSMLMGGTAADTFSFQPTGSVPLLVDGGLGSNILDYSGDGGAAASVNLQTGAASRINGGAAGGFKNIQRLVGSSAASDLLVGPDALSGWLITGGNAGGVGAFTFSGVENLRGGLQNDAFRFSATGSLLGSIDGGGGSNTLNYSTDGGVAATINLQTHAASRLHGGLSGGFAHVQTVIGSTSASDRLLGPAIATLWRITGANAGFAGSVAFSGVENLQGAAASDTFRFSPAGTVSGSVAGGGGGDWLDYSTFTSAVGVNLATGAATNVAAGAAGKATQIQNVTGGSGNDILVGNALGNILMGGGGNDTITAGSGRSILIGGAGADKVNGGLGDDLLIAGTTNFDSNHPALMAILKEWQRTDKTYAQRITDLKSGGGLNGVNKLIWGTTVHDDTAADTLTGNAGLDWFFENLGPGGILDHLSDRNNGGAEQVN
jgi:autotransporter-associated beta strand protein